MSESEFTQRLTRREQRQTYKNPDPFTSEELRTCYIEKRMSQREIAAFFHYEMQIVHITMKQECITRQDKIETVKKLHPDQVNPQINLCQSKYYLIRELLYYLYIRDRLTIREIADNYQRVCNSFGSYLRKFNISTRGGKHPPRKNEELYYQGRLESFYKHYKGRAGSRNLDFELTIDQFEILVTKPCVFCGFPPSQKRGKYFFSGIDRSDNTLGYILGNVRSCCRICNRAKSIMPEDEFIQWVLQVADHLRSSSMEWVCGREVQK